MQISCEHGYFTFRESSPGDVGRFASLFEGLSIVQVSDYFTFKALESAPTYSIKGNPYLGATAIETFEGRPQDVMRANKLVYDFRTDKVVSISAITQRVELQVIGYAYLSPGLILPGSLTDEGSRVTDYAAWYLFGSGRFKYSGVTSA